MSMTPTPTSTPLLTIAGFDPSSGAGITADLAVFAAHGFFGLSSITALTVQSTLGVRAVHAVDAPIFAAALACLDEDLPAAGVKVGMLATAENVHAVADFLVTRAAGGIRAPVVLDPVLESSSGRQLLSPEGVDALCERLLPAVGWVTPNRSELARLLGRPIAGRSQVEAAAWELRRRYPALNVAVTGGDEEAPDDFIAEAGGAGYWLRGTRIESTATHGTGCAFSSALLCGLVAGKPRAAEAAKAYVAKAILTAVPLGSGKGPMNLLWPLAVKD